jgi:hypothetical protein
MEAIKLQLSTAVQSVVDGEQDPLEVLALIVDLEKHVKKCKEKIESDAINEAVKFEKTFKHKGFEFTYCEGRRTYDFKHIQEWVDADKKKKEIEEKAKQAAYMKEKNILGVTGDGEVIEPCVVKSSKPFLTIKQDKSL